MNDHIPDKLALASYLTDDLSDQKKNEIENHLNMCEKCRGYLNQLKKEKKLFLEKFPIESLSLPKTEKIIRFPIMKHVYALAASIILVVTGIVLYSVSQPQQITMRIKGGNSIKILVQNLNGDVEERTNQTYSPFERIQLIYSCTKQNNFMLFSIDEQGKLSTFLPSGSDSSIALQTGADIPLPHSIQLDDYIGKELFVAIFSEQKLHSKIIKEQLTTQYKKTRALENITIVNTKAYSAHSILITKTEELP